MSGETAPIVSGAVVGRPEHAPRALTVWLLGATLFAVPLVFTTLTFNQFLLPQALVLRVLSAAALASALPWLRTVADPGRRVGPALPACAYGLVLLLGTAWSVSPGLSWRGEYGNVDGTLLQWHALLLFFVTAWAVRTAHDRALLLESACLAGVVAAVYVLLQAAGLDFVDADVSFAGYGRFDGTSGNPLIAGALLAALVPLATALLASDEPVALRRRVVGLALAIPLAASFWLALAVGTKGAARVGPALAASLATPAAWVLGGTLLCASIQCAAARRGGLGVARVAALAGLAALFVRAIAETGSRSAVLALAAGLPLGALAGWAALRARRETRSAPRAARAAAGIAFAIVALVAVSAATSSTSRIFGSLLAPVDALSQSRSNIWRPALAMWRARPVTGWGVDTFMRVFPAFETPFRPAENGELQVPQNAHSEPLMLLATLGVPGLLAWLAVLATWAAGAWRRMRSEPSHGELVVQGACVAGVAVLVSYGLMGIPSPALRALFWILLALSMPDVAGTSRPWSVPGWARGLAAAAALAVSVVPAVQVFRADRFYKVAFVSLRAGEALRGVAPAAALAAGSAALAAVPRGDASLERQRAALAAALPALEGAVRAGVPQAAAAAERFARLALDLQAIALQERAVALAPREPQYRWFLGETLARRYESFPEDPERAAWFARARGAYEAAIARSGRDVFSTASLARLEFQRFLLERDPGAADAARRLYGIARRDAPYVRPFLRDAVALELDTGRPDAALALITALVPHAPDVAAEILAAHAGVPALCSDGRAGACREVVRRALARNPASDAARAASRALGW